MSICACWGEADRSSSVDSSSCEYVGGGSEFDMVIVMSEMVVVLDKLDLVAGECRPLLQTVACDARSSVVAAHLLSTFLASVHRRARSKYDMIQLLIQTPRGRLNAV